MYHKCEWATNADSEKCGNAFCVNAKVKLGPKLEKNIKVRIYYN